jgi:hypothetical protein
VDSFGIQIPAANISSLVITQILDNQNPSVNVYQAPNPAFVLVNNLDGTYNITTNQAFVRGVNASQNRSFTFYFELKTNDGVGSEITSLFTETADVCNIDPLFGGSDSGGYSGVGDCPPDFIQISPEKTESIYTFYGRNGSLDNATQAANGEVYLDVTFELVSVLNSLDTSTEIINAFELGSVIPWNSTNLEPTKVDIFKLSSFQIAGSYILTIRVIDADGAETFCTFGIEILNQGCTCKEFSAYGSQQQNYTKCDGSPGNVFFSNSQSDTNLKKYRCARTSAAGVTCDPTTCK